ncbi:hypothetical protein TRIUR3_02770 [Triticum urartu]|uniref:Uncharacterized protein n=1 Tax=Triticum urartu TaxID=4572 RepID=M7Z1K5_TRIUA|nr:hypothetical protein TRIUR3_02770 [Triticum urartu]
MGNCQAAEAAAVVIQHPGDGKVERLHWPTTAADVMRRNPGHYVALVLLHHDSRGVDPDPAVPGGGGGARITKVKLLKPRDTLHLGQVYRLITSQDGEAMQLSDAHSIDLSRTVDVEGNMAAMDLAGEAPHLWPPWKNTSSS